MADTSFEQCPCHKGAQFSSVAQSCLNLCDPMNRSTPGLPVHHQAPGDGDGQGGLRCCSPRVHRVCDRLTRSQTRLRDGTVLSESLMPHLRPPATRFPSTDQCCPRCVFGCSVIANSLRPFWTVAYQAPLSIGFFRQEYWSGEPLPSP